MKGERRKKQYKLDTTHVLLGAQFPCSFFMSNRFSIGMCGVRVSLFEGSEISFILIPRILVSFFEPTTCQHSYTIIVSTLYLSFLWLLKKPA